MTEKALVMLINLSWQLALLFLLARLIPPALKIRSASVRRIIWLAVVLCPLVLVPMNFISSDIVLVRSNNLEQSMPIAPHLDLTRPSINQGKTSFPMTLPVEESAEKKTLGKPLPGQPETKTPLSNRLPRAIQFRLKPLLVVAWLLGVGAGIVLIFAGFVRLRKLMSKARQIEDEAVLRISHQVKEEIAVARDVRLFASDKVRTPFSVGFVRPCIVLPDQMLDSHKKLRMVLAHEAVHLKQFDYLINLLCRIIGSFMFFHPLFHLAVRELRLSSEEICDGWAIELTGNRADYADCLMELSRACAGRLPIGFGRGRNSVARRMRSILKSKEAFRMISKRRVVFLSVSLFLLILAASAMRLVNPVLAELSLGTPTMESSPAGGGYLRFPKIDDHRPIGKKAIGLVDLPSTAFRDIDGITIEGWIFFEELPAYNQTLMLFQKPEGFQLTVKGEKDSGRVQIEGQSRWKERESSHSGGGGGSDGFNLETNTWYYFYRQFEAKYEDLLDETYLPLAIGAKCFYFDLVENEDSPQLRLVSDYIQFAGGIDELRISNTLRYLAALEDTFIGDKPSDHGLQELPQKPFKPDANTVALWHFDDPDNFFADASNGLVIRPYGWLDPQKKMSKPRPTPARPVPKVEEGENPDDEVGVKFADPNLEAVVRKHIRKSEGTINRGDCRKMLPILDAGDKHIRDLGGIENCVGLFFLNLSGNEVEDVSPLSSFVRVNDMVLMGNRIADLRPLSGLNSLTGLGLDENRIVDVKPLSNLTNLTDLSLSGNQIVDIEPLSNLPNLQFLMLSDNQISDISPLVDNPGIGKRDEIALLDNPLNDAAYDVHIPALQKRGVRVGFDPKE